MPRSPTPIHGRRVTYVHHHCRCPACTDANTRYIRDRRHQTGRIRYRRHQTGRIPTDGLLTPCWCEAHADYLAPAQVWRGQTWSCGRPDCQPPEAS